MKWLKNKEKRQQWMQFVQGFHPDISPQTIRLLDELGFVSRAIYHMMSGHSEDDAGLSFAQYRVLTHLYFAEHTGRKSGLNPSEISDRQGVSRNTMSTFIRSLEEDGLIVRHLDPDDRRRFNISLTDSGRELIRKYTHDHLEMIDQCFDILTPAEQKSLLHLLQKLGGHVATMRQPCAEDHHEP